MRRLLALVVAAGSLTLASVAPVTTASAATVKKTAAIVSVTRLNTQTSFALDYVEIVPCSTCENDFEIRNVNPLIRSFMTTPTTKYVLLKANTPTVTMNVTLAQFREARFGRDVGQYLFDPDQPFEFRLDEKKKTISEVRQLYFP